MRQGARQLTGPVPRHPDLQHQKRDRDGQHPSLNASSRVVSQVPVLYAPVDGSGGTAGSAMPCDAFAGPVCGGCTLT